MGKEKKELPAILDPEGERIMALAKICNTDHPEPADMAALKKAMDEHPTWFKDFLEPLTQRTMTAVFNRTNGITLVSMRCQYEKIRRDLGYEQAQGVEQQLIELVAMAWWQLNHAMTRYAVNVADGQLEVCNYWEKRLTMTEHRYLRAVETLAKFRRLAIPMSVQVNQLNLGAMAAAGLRIAAESHPRQIEQ